MVRPFTLTRLIDLLRLIRVYKKVEPELVADSMMTSKDRALELLRQAEDMGFIVHNDHKYSMTRIGYEFFEAFKNNDRERLDELLSRYPPYLCIKNILSKRSASLSELSEITGLTEVSVETIIRLMRYTCDDLCTVAGKFYLRRNELPSLKHFIEILKQVYKELNTNLWGCPKEFIRMDQVARRVCMELRLKMVDFSRLLKEAQRRYRFIEVYSEGTGFDFLPYHARFSLSNHRRCFIRIRL